MHDGLLSKVSISNFFRLCFEHSFAFLFKFWTTRWWYNPPLTRDFLLFFLICLSDVYSQLRPIFPRPLFGPSSSIMHAAYPFHPTNPSVMSHVLLYKISTALNNKLQCFDWLIHSVAKKLGSFGANISREFITWCWRHRLQHFSPGASECKLTLEAYSLTDGNWPVLYSAPPIPAGICRNPPEFTGMRLESTGIHQNPQE